MIEISGPMKYESGLVIRNSPSVAESRDEMVLKKFTSIMISAMAAPIRVVVRAIDQAIILGVVSSDSAIVEIPIIKKPRAMILLLLFLPSVILPSGYWISGKGKSIITRIIPIDSQLKPTYLFRYIGL
jgi:hypothetical protein